MRNTLSKDSPFPFSTLQTRPTCPTGIPSSQNPNSLHGNMTSKRTRTGCKTCRGRKLKCDEARPICTQCQKSNRECVPSDGIAFRHSQNAGLNAVGGGLDNFYKYRQTFAPDQYFVPIPSELRFVHVTDPYEEDPNTQSSTDYQHLAAHSLEALSTAAAGNPQPTLRAHTYNEHTGGYTQSGGRQAGSNHIQGIQEHTDLHFLLNSSSHTPSALIDPNLEASTEQSAVDAIQEVTQTHDGKDQGQGDMHTDDDGKLDVSHFDRQVLAALQNSGDSTIEGVM